MFTIGQLARATGVNLETIRYYERISLMPEPVRTSGGHRAYDDGHRRRLSFIRRSRELGFTLEQIRELLRLSAEEDRPCCSVEQIASAHLQDVRGKIDDLRRLEALLAASVERCADTRGGASCAVLEMLSE